MKTGLSSLLTLLPAVLLLGAITPVQAQQPASAFERGTGLQSWQHPNYPALIAQCKTPPAPFRIGGGAQAAASNAEPPAPALPAVQAIADIVAAAIRPVRFACAALMSHSAQGELVCGWRNRDVLPELAIRPKDQNAVVSRHHHHPA